MARAQLVCGHFAGLSDRTHDDVPWRTEAALLASIAEDAAQSEVRAAAGVPLTFPDQFLGVNHAGADALATMAAGNPANDYAAVLAQANTAPADVAALPGSDTAAALLRYMRRTELVVPAAGSASAINAAGECNGANVNPGEELQNQAADYHFFNHAFDTNTATVAWPIEQPPAKALRIAALLGAGMPQAERKMIRGCSLNFDRSHDAELYNPTGAGITAELTEDGILRGRDTGVGPYYHAATPGQSLEDAVRHIQDTYFTVPPPVAPAGVAVAQALDPNDRIYVFVPDRIDLPVVTYEERVVVDYTPRTYIRGLVVVQARGTRNATTRDLHVKPETRDLVDVRTASVRHFTGPELNEPWGTFWTNYFLTNGARQGLSDTLSFNFPNGRDNTPLGGLLINGTGMAAQQGIVDVAPPEQGPDISVLGGPVPLQLLGFGALGPHVSDVLIGFDALMAAAEPLVQHTKFYIAPLMERDALNEPRLVSDPGPLQADVLAGRIASTRYRNSIGIAMQTMTSCRQADVMLHDGV